MLGDMPRLSNLRGVMGVWWTADLCVGVHFLGALFFHCRESPTALPHARALLQSVPSAELQTALIESDVFGVPFGQILLGQRRQPEIEISGSTVGANIVFR